MVALKKNLLLAHPRYWLIWLGVSLLWLTTRLSVRWRLCIGNSLGRLIYRFGAKLRRITEINIQLCFPDLSFAAQQQLIKKNFQALGVGAIEAAMAWWLPKEKLSSLFTLHGFEHAERAFAQGKGIIFLSPHFTCLEMVGRLISMKSSFAVMYRPHKNRVIAFMQEHFRQKNQLQAIPRHQIRQLIRALNNNVGIWYAYDVDGGPKRSVFAPFFGVPTASLTSVSRIVRMSGAAVVPVSFYRRDDEFHYDVICYPPVEDFPTDDLQSDAAQLNNILENAIRQKPEQYIWQYKRFKTRPAGESRVY